MTVTPDGLVTLRTDRRCRNISGIRGGGTDWDTETGARSRCGGGNARRILVWDIKNKEVQLTLNFLIL